MEQLINCSFQLNCFILQSFFVSLGANDNVLPSYILSSDDSDLISHYFSRKGKRSGLLSFFNFAKESILPERVKKPY